MISRFTVSAAIFAVLVTTGLAFAADKQPMRVAATSTASGAAMPSITFPQVEITGHRPTAR